MIAVHSSAWRRIEERVSVAQQVLAMSSIKDMLATIELDHPAKNIPKITDGFGSTEWLGVIKGYELALSRFRELGEPLIVHSKELIPDWGVEEVTVAKKK